MFYMSACEESLFNLEIKKNNVHYFDSDSSCWQFNEDLVDGMPLLISFSSLVSLLLIAMSVQLLIRRHSRKLPTIELCSQGRNTVKCFEYQNTYFTGVTYFGFSYYSPILR